MTGSARRTGSGFAAHHGADALLHKVSSRVGLTVDDYAALAE